MSPSRPDSRDALAMALLETLSNREVSKRMQGLAERLDRLAESAPPARPLREAPGRRCGDVSRTVRQVLVASERPMQMSEIYAEVDALLGESIPRNTIKFALWEGCRRSDFVRLARGRYSFVSVER